MLLAALLTGCDQNPVAQREAKLPPAAAEAAVSPADVRFAIDARVTAPISPFIYGVNSYHRSWDGASPPDNLTLGRMGGNRLSAFNWENNASNAGSDWYYQNDGALGGGETPGEAVRQRVQAVFDRGAAMMVTVPMLGYVAADKKGPVGTDEATLSTRLATRFRESRPRKGSPFSLRPDPHDRYVYQDEFVWWLNRAFPQAADNPRQPILYSLDNEPDIWHETHEQIRSKVNGRANLLTYDEMVRRTIEYASAIKDVVPGAQVLGPVVATWTGATTLGRWPHADPVAGKADFLDYYLDKMREAERVHGRRLVDVVDVHWYSAARAGGRSANDDTAPQTPELVQARLQAPRSLWDPDYVEGSWVNDVTGGPIQLLPRLKRKIADRYPGTRIAVTEYYYGGGGDVSGGIAQADVLGIFGREGVFAAALWPNAKVKAAYNGDGKKAYGYIFGGLKMFRDYDGNGGSFGDIGLSATTSHPEQTSVYASVDAGKPERLVIVAINKSSKPMVAGVALAHSQPRVRAEVYTLTDAGPDPVRQPDLALPRGSAFHYTMPPLSVSTLVLR